jgi:hypothetical protein
MKDNEFFRETILDGIVIIIPFPMVCGMSHNSSRLESYDHVKLENPGLGNGPKFV